MDLEVILQWLLNDSFRPGVRPTVLNAENCSAQTVIFKEIGKPRVRNVSGGEDRWVSSGGKVRGILKHPNPGTAANTDEAVEVGVRKRYGRVHAGGSAATVRSMRFCQYTVARRFNSSSEWVEDTAARLYYVRTDENNGLSPPDGPPGDGPAPMTTNAQTTGKRWPVSQHEKDEDFTPERTTPETKAISGGQPAAAQTKMPADPKKSKARKFAGQKKVQPSRAVDVRAVHQGLLEPRFLSRDRPDVLDLVVRVHFLLHNRSFHHDGGLSSAGGAHCNMVQGGGRFSATIGCRPLGDGLKLKITWGH